MFVAMMFGLANGSAPAIILLPIILGLVLLFAGIMIEVWNDSFLSPF
jgi:hypothetical protein